jgi:hypothetical protein
MNVLSAILRFICGVALILTAYLTNRRIGAQVAAGQPIEIAGVNLGASPGELSWALGAVGLIGVLLIVFGAITLLKKQA